MTATVTGTKRLPVGHDPEATVLFISAKRLAGWRYLIASNGGPAAPPSGISTSDSKQLIEDLLEEDMIAKQEKGFEIISTPEEYGALVIVPDVLRCVGQDKKNLQILQGILDNRDKLALKKNKEIFDWLLKTYPGIKTSSMSNKLVGWQLKPAQNSFNCGFLYSHPDDQEHRRLLPLSRVLGVCIVDEQTRKKHIFRSSRTRPLTRSSQASPPAPSPPAPAPDREPEPPAQDPEPESVAPVTEMLFTLTYTALSVEDLERLTPEQRAARQRYLDELNKLMQVLAEAAEVESTLLRPFQQADTEADERHAKQERLAQLQQRAVEIRKKISETDAELAALPPPAPA